MNQPTPKIGGTKICRLYAADGKCRFGAKCHFLHVPNVPGGVETAPAVPPGAVEVARAPAKVPVKFADWGSFWSKRSIAVSEYHTGVLTWLQEQGAPVTGLERPMVEHPVSRYCREWAMHRVCKAIYNWQPLTGYRVLSWFGAERDKDMLTRNSFDMHGCLLEHPTKGDSTWEFVCAPDKYARGDRGRVAGRMPLPPGLFDGVVIVDVYYGLDGGRWDESSLTRMCALSRTNTVYVIQRDFVGCAGGDAEVDGEVEGRWIEDPVHADYINFIPSRKERGFPAHPRGVDISRKYLGELSINVFAHCGPYVLICIGGPGEHMKDDFDRRGTISSAPWATRASVVYPGWANAALNRLGLRHFRSEFLQRTFGTEEFLPHVTLTLAQVQLEYELKTATGRSLDNATVAVSSLLKTDPVFRALEASYPACAIELRRGTAYTAFYGTREHVAGLVLGLRTGFLDQEQQLATATSVAGPLVVRRSVWLRLSTAMVLCLGLWVLLTWMQNLGADALVLECALESRPTSVYQTYVMLVASFMFAWFCATMTWRRFLWGLYYTGFVLGVGDIVERCTVHAAVAPISSQEADSYAMWVICAIICGLLCRAYRLRVVVDSRPFKRWLDRRAEHEFTLSEFSRVTHIDEGCVIPAERGEVCGVVGKGSMSVRVDGVSVTLEQAYALVRNDEAKSPNDLYPVICSVGTGYAPARTDHNLLNALVYRTHVQTRGEQDAGKLGAVWDGVYACVSAILMRHLADQGIEFTMEEASAKLAPTKRRALFEEMKNMDRSGRRLRVVRSMKPNETLGLKLLADHLAGGTSYCIRPRVLVVFSICVHVDLTQSAHVVSRVMHDTFNGTALQVGSHSVVVYFASGYTGVQLNAVGEALLHYPEVIVVAGDDGVMKSLALVPADEVRDPHPYEETDQEIFDQSQGREALSAVLELLSLCGLEARHVSNILHLCSMSYKAQGKRVTVRGSPGYQMGTGIDLTTVINSMSCLAMQLSRYASPGSRIEELAFFLGFSVKVSRRRTLQGTTFLKGWWLDSGEGSVTWVPLPSQVGKIGKTGRNPRLFSKTGKDYSAGLRDFAFSMARGMGTIPRDYPILGALLAAYDRCGQGGAMSTRVTTSEDGWYKPEVTGSIERNAAVSAVCDRYDICVADIERVEALYDAVRQMPAFVEDPVLCLLAEVDYGVPHI